MIHRTTACSLAITLLFAAIGAHQVEAAGPTTNVVFSTFPGSGRPPANLNGIYGPPGTTQATPLSDEFAPLGIVFTAPNPTLLLGQPSCTICIGFAIVAPATIPGDVNIRFLVPVTSVTVRVIGSGPNIAARLNGFNRDGAIVGSVSHTHAGPTGQFSSFTLTAPPAESFLSVTFDGSLNPSAYASMGSLAFTALDAPPKAVDSADGLIWDDQVNGAANSVDTVSEVAAEGDWVFVAGTIRSTRQIAPGVTIGFATLALRTYNAWTGALHWEDLATFEDFGTANALAVYNGRVFVGGLGGFDAATGLLRAYDALTGTLLWQDRIPPTFAQTSVSDIAVSDQGLFAVGALSQRFGVRAYDSNTGALRWQDIAIFSNVSNATDVVVDDDRVFVVGGSLFESAIRAYDALTGVVLWDVRSADYQPSAIVVNGSRLFTAGRIRHPSQQDAGDFVVRTYDRNSGVLLWEDRVYGFDGNSGVASDVVTDGRSVYAVGRVRINDSLAGTGEFAVLTYDAETGQRRWMNVVGSPGTTETATAAVLRQGQLIVSGTLDVLGTGSDFVVRTYDAETGELLWDDYVNGTANAADVAVDVAVLPHAVYVAGSLTNLIAQQDFTVRAYYKY